jgi:hypothetical protein
MRYAIIDSGKVVNTIEAPVGWTDPAGRVLVATDAASKGDSYDGTSFTPAVKVVVPSRRDEYAALSTATARIAYIAWVLGLASKDE